MDLGRFQPGDIIHLEFDTVNGDDVLTAPDASPTVTIVDADSVVVRPQTGIGASGSYVHFELALFVSALYPLGTYTVTCSWLISGSSFSASATFTVIGGGDIGGSIISMRAYVRPEASYVVAQLNSGNIVQGRNPRL